MGEEKEIMTIRQVAEYLQISEVTTYRLVQADAPSYPKMDFNHHLSAQ